MKESQLKKQICESAKKVPKLLLLRRMAAGNNAGEPDIYGIFNGKHVEIEVKVGKGKPTELQKYRLETWTMYDAIAGCVWSMKDVFALLSPHVTNHEQFKILEKQFWKEPKE